jgi:hypothetical protein
MNSYKKHFFNFLAVIGLLAGFAAAAQAQATRTWISGVGDDANPCSRTAPCKTFQGTISKTAANGEINAIDPGGFGGVTITKTITIDVTNVLAGILVSGSNGIIINDSGSNSIVVTIRGMDINGLGSGISGIRIVSAKAVIVENTTIYGFTNGISDERSGGGSLFVNNSTIRSNVTTGVNIATASTPATNATFENVRFVSNGTGLVVRAGNSAIIRNSFVSDNPTIGISVNDAGSELSIENCMITYNAFGVSIKTGTPIVRISNTMVTKNDTGLRPGSGQILSYSNNKISGNNIENNPTGNIPPL